MNENILFGTEEPFNINFESLGKFLFGCLKKRKPDDIFGVDVIDNKKLTCGEVLSQSIRLSKALSQLHITKEDVVMFLLENTVESFVPMLALFYIGAPISLANPSYSLAELSNLLNICKPKAIICPKSSLDNVLKLKKEYDFIKTVILMDGCNDVEGLLDVKTLAKEVYVNEKQFEPGQTNAKDSVTLITSSGTTGVPKCVDLSNENFLQLICCGLDKNGMYITRDDITILTLPPFHLFGFLIYISTIVSSMKLMMLKSFTPRVFLECVQKYKANKLFFVPTLLHFLATSPLVNNFDISSLKDIIVGGGYLSEHLYKVATERLSNVSIRQAYGATEVSGAIIMQPFGDNFRRVGLLIKNVSAKVIDLETGIPLGPFQNGEICFKGICVMKGYYNNSVETRNAIDSDGFYHTGDVGYYNKEGYFHIVDRIKDIIKYKGFQVSPTELERILLSHPAIMDCVVVGVDNEKDGQLATALVVPNSEINVTEKEIVDFVSERISRHKRLHGGVKFIDKMIKNSVGKISRIKMAEVYLKNQIYT